MKSRKAWLIGGAHTLAAAVGFAVAVGLTYAKLPQPPMDDAAKAKADEAKAKAADAAKKARADEEAAMDRVVAHYKKDKGGKASTAAPAPAPTPAPGSKKK